MPITCNQDKQNNNPRHTNTHGSQNTQYVSFDIQHHIEQSNSQIQTASTTTPTATSTITPQTSAKFPNFILHLFSAKCTQFLKTLTRNSIISIQHEYFNDQTTKEVEELKTLVDTAPYFTVLALFFLLLNVDANLKDKVWDLELATNHPKLERFLIDLKHPIVSEFCIDDAISTPMFIDQIWETYVLA